MAIVLYLHCSVKSAYYSEERSSGVSVYLCVELESSRRVDVSAHIK